MNAAKNALSLAYFVPALVKAASENCPEDLAWDIADYALEESKPERDECADQDLFDGLRALLLTLDIAHLQTFISVCDRAEFLTENCTRNLLASETQKEQARTLHTWEVEFCSLKARAQTRLKEISELENARRKKSPSE
jgi:hypothetical protein